MSGPFGGTHWMAKSGETIDWGGVRMINAGGTTGNGGSAAGDADSIDYVNVSGANADSTDFGDLSAVKQKFAACSNGHGGLS